MKKIYAILIIFVFSYQALPLESVGKLLSSGTMNEETLHGQAMAKKFSLEDKHYYYEGYFSEISEHQNLRLLFLAFDEEIMQHPHIDVLLQPPNT